MRRLVVSVLLLASAAGGAWPAIGETPPGTAGASAAPVWFEDVTEASGLDFVHRRALTPRLWFPEIMSGGGGFFDADGDGDLDLYLVQGGDLADPAAAPGNQLYENRGRGADGQVRFVDITARAGVGDRGYGMGLAVGDIDGDGDEDIYVTNYGANVLYENLGGGTDGGPRFADITASAGVGDRGWSASAAFADYDADGDLDLFVVNYVRWTPEQEIECFSGAHQRDYCQPENYRAPAADTLYRNDGRDAEGRLRFTDVTAAAGLGAAFGNGLGVATADFDGDGRLDFYVANDGTANQLWLQTAAGRFRDEALLAGAALNQRGVAEAGMGVAAIDVESDGDADLFVTHLRDESNTLYLGDGTGLFEDRTATSGLAAPSIPLTGFGLAFADFDHDGQLDLYVANGRVGRAQARAPRAGAAPPDPFGEPNQLFRGLGAARFAALPATAHPAVVETSRAAALGDYDGDGDLDLLIVNNGAPARLLANRVGEARAALRLRPFERGGIDAIGARIGVRIGDLITWRLVNRSNSYCATNTPEVHFGLGAAGRADDVWVVWLDGEREHFGARTAGAPHELRRGSGRPDPAGADRTPPE